jgi:selenocysteine-specific elongation factor
MIIGTAGHIDHGKTSLVRALTGVDTDRLPEEKRRGITIALGFAPLELPGIGTVGVVDVPGHEAFVRTMLAGATGIDCALIVIAADEGVMPQTREHVEILRLLKVPRAVVALTKADLADDELRTLVTMDVEELLRETALAGAPIITVSATTGEGLDALRAALVDALRDAPSRDADDVWRLPVDRVFSVAGAGTVVTGTAWSGSIAAGDTVRLVPGDRTARIRGLESHGNPTERSTPGARLAVALVGIDREAIHPGSVLVSARDPWHSTNVLRADLALVPEAAPVGVRSRLRFHLGTAECGARIVVTGGTLNPGRTVAARIVLDAPLVVRAGDRFVLRGGSPHTTIGGGLVTDPLPITPRARPWPSTDAEPRERLQWMLAEASAAGIEIAPLSLRLGLRPSEVEKLLKTTKGTARVGDRLVESAVLDAMRTQLLAHIARAHEEAPLAPGLDLQTARAALTPSAALADEVIRRAERAGVLELVGSALRLPGWDPAAAGGAGDRRANLLATLEAAGAEPPSVAELQAAQGQDVPALLKLLEKDGSAMPIALDRWFATSAVRALLERLRNGTSPAQRYSPSELRELLGISRKYLIPFLEWCDRRGISRRAEDGRSFPTVPENP